MMQSNRDAIALQGGLATGTVTNIISQWKLSIGQYVAEDLQELGKSEMV